MPSSDDDDECYGPALPPSMLSARESAAPASSTAGASRIIGPCMPPPTCSSDDEGQETKYGPALPPSHMDRQNDPSPPPGHESSSAAQVSDDSEELDGDDFIGPVPAAADDDQSAESARTARADLERRAAAMKNKLQEDDSVMTRESWMLELPEDKAKQFGLGPRQFRRSAAPERGDTSVWTDTPADKLKKRSRAAADDNSSSTKQRSCESGAPCDTAARRRDEKITAMVESAGQRSRDSSSLLDIHRRQRRQTEQQKKDGGEERQKRREFDRDLDLGANKFDEAQKNAAIKRSRGARDMFTSGARKFL